jgi:hypothetical protein
MKPSRLGEDVVHHSSKAPRPPETERTDGIAGKEKEP